MTRAFGGLAAALLSTVVWSASARDTPVATVDDAARAKARALGYAGVEAYGDGDYATASAKLEESFQLLPVPSLGLWSARALVGLGRWVEAEQRYRAVAILTVGASDSPVQQQAKDDAQRERAELLRRIPSLKVRIAGASPDEVTVSVDGTARRPAELATALLVNPGRHEISGVRGSERSQVVLSLDERAHEEVELRFGQAPLAATSGTGSPSSAASPSPPATEPAHSMPSPSSGAFDDGGVGARQALRMGAWVAVGAGVTGLATGVVTYVLADRQYEGFKRRDLCSNGGCSQDEVDTYNTLRDIHGLSFIAGGLLAAAGATVLVLTWEEPAQRHQVRLELGPGAASVSGSF